MKPMRAFTGVDGSVVFCSVGWLLPDEQAVSTAKAAAQANKRQKALRNVDFLCWVMGDLLYFSILQLKAL